jgi:hypothetical protein
MRNFGQHSRFCGNKVWPGGEFDRAAVRSPQFTTTHEARREGLLWTKDQTRFGRVLESMDVG